MRTAIFPAVAALALALPASAQQPAPAPGAMQRCMAVMGGHPPSMLLEQAEQLGLSAEQVSRLEAIRDGTDVSAQLQAVRAAHARAAELLRADAPDLDEYEDAIEEATEEMVAAHVAVVGAGLEARAVLTPEQRTTLETLHPMDMMRPDRPMMQRDTPMMHRDTTMMMPRDTMMMPRDTTMMPMHRMPHMGAAGDALHHAMMMQCMMLEPMGH